MMTKHTAKGLEFPYVFACGLNEGIFPSIRTDTADKMEEERRLAYVAYTRAEKLLFLSGAEGTNYDGSFRFPSRFIFNTEKTYLNYVVELEHNLIEDAQDFIIADEQKKSTDLIEFQIGDEIYHKTLGRGRIIDIKKEINAYVIKFDNAKTERNIERDSKQEKKDTDVNVEEFQNKKQLVGTVNEDEIEKGTMKLKKISPLQ